MADTHYKRRRSIFRVSAPGRPSAQSKFILAISTLTKLAGGDSIKFTRFEIEPDELSPRFGFCGVQAKRVPMNNAAMTQPGCMQNVLLMRIRYHREWFSMGLS